MDWSEFCLCFAFTNITGTIGCILCMMFQDVLERFGLKLAALKAVILMYLVPAVYLILRLSQIEYTSGVWVRFGFRMEDISSEYSRGFNYVGIIWVMGLIAGIALRLRQYLRFRRVMRDNEPMTDPEWQSVVDECAQKYHLKAVKIYRNSNLDSALVTGLFKPVIVLPFTEYFPEERYMVAEHELYHIHNRDLMWKQLAMLVSWLHWYNPLVYWVINQVIREQEINCDLSVCSVNPNYTVKAYCNFLFESAAGGSTAKGNDRMYAASIMETKSFLVWRIEMIAKKKKMRTAPKWAVLMICMILVMGAALPAYAAADKIVEIEEAWIASKEVKIDVSGEPRKEVTVYSVLDEGAPNEVYMDEEISTYSSVINVDITIAANTRVLYSARAVEEGEEIELFVNCSDSNVKFRVGIKNVDTEMMCYIEGTGTLTYAFAAPETGVYRPIVENLSGEEAEFKGMIVYP